MEHSTDLFETNSATEVFPAEGNAALLEPALIDALQRAADRDREGQSLMLPDEWSDGLPQTHTECAQAILDYYRSNQVRVDTVVWSALNFLQSSRGTSYVKTIQDLDERGEAGTVVEQIIDEMSQSEEFTALQSSSQADNGQAWGLGISGGANFYLGPIGGVGLIFEYQADNDVTTRGWAGGSLESGKSISLGLEVSTWDYLPLKGLVFGILMDGYMTSSPYPYLGFVRFLCTFQRDQLTKKYVLAGFSVQFPFGKAFGFPYMMGVYVGYQWAKSRKKRTDLTVVNEDGGANSIIVNSANNTLRATLTNISAGPIEVGAGATLKLGMPYFFSADDVGVMNVDYPGWTFSIDGTTLILTRDDDYLWNTGPNAAISFAITNVASSSSLANRVTQEGLCNLTLDLNTSARLPIAGSTKFYLVPVSSSATLNWTVTLNPEDFKLVQGSALSGTVDDAIVQGGTNIIQLSSVENVNDSTDVWILGYVFNYNDLTGDPQVCAAWLKQGAPQRGSNVEYGDYTSTSKTVDCYYAGLDSTGSSISIDVEFTGQPSPEEQVGTQPHCR